MFIRFTDDNENPPVMEELHSFGLRHRVEDVDPFYSGVGFLRSLNLYINGRLYDSAFDCEKQTKLRSIYDYLFESLQSGAKFCTLSGTCLPSFMKGVIPNA